jgi:predicted TIM-barrel fold metal-dependent hydrolase
VSANPGAHGPLISADSHVVEPGTLWLEGTARRYRERVPRIVSTADTDLWHYESGETVSFAAFASAGNWQGRSDSNMRVADLRPAISEPRARLVEAEQDGVVAEVLYPSFAMRLFGIQEPDYQQELFRAYNDWVAAFCSAAPERLVPHAALSILDPAAAAVEARRLAKRGFRGVLLNAHPRPGMDLGNERYEQLWSTLEDCGLRASLHLYAGDTEPRPLAFLAAYSTDPVRVQESIATLVFSGVAERHPRLRFVIVESDVGWLAHLLSRMDRAFTRKAPRWGSALTSGLLPSEIFKRQFSCVLTDDRAAILAREITGTQVLMWGSDYPHNDSSWPDSAKVLDSVLAGVDAAERRGIVHDNAARLYGIRSAGVGG